MKHLHRSFRDAFTLIELLVVVAIIAILAAFLFPVMTRISITQSKTMAKAELGQIVTAIENYKSTYNYYPPDNTTNAAVNPLYYELSGTTQVVTNGNENAFLVLDGSHWVSTNDVIRLFNVNGIANNSAGLRGSDEQRAARPFLKDLKPAQIGNLTTNGSSRPGRVLLCSQTWSGTGPTDNPWRYNSSHPTNNPNSYDLWVDLYLAKKTNRISNWSREPQIL